MDAPDRTLTIPEIRSKMLAVSEEIRLCGCTCGTCDELVRDIEHLANSTYRVQTKRRTKVETLNRPVSAWLRWRIQGYAKRYPNASFVDIGVRFKVNPARISEIIVGKRGEH